MQLSNKLSAREKRQMLRDLTTAQESIEEATDARNKKIGEFYQRGMSISGLMASTGLGYNTLQNIIKAQGIDTDLTGTAGSADTE